MLTLTTLLCGSFYFSTPSTMNRGIPGEATTGGSDGIGIFMLLYMILQFISMVRLFKVANVPIWKAFIPIYNIWTLAKIVKLPGLSIICFCIPFVDVIYNFIFMSKLSNAYNRGILMTIALIVFYPIAIVILAFSSKTEYVGWVKKPRREH